MPRHYYMPRLFFDLLRHAIYAMPPYAPLFQRAIITGSLRFRGRAHAD